MLGCKGLTLSEGSAKSDQKNLHKLWFVYGDFAAVVYVWYLDPASDVERKIYKARAEEFIHIFVHQKAKLIEFLEHMVQVLSHFQITTVSVFFQNLRRRYEILVSEKDLM